MKNNRWPIMRKITRQTMRTMRGVWLHERGGDDDEKKERSGSKKSFSKGASDLSLSFSLALSPRPSNERFSRTNLSSFSNPSPAPFAATRFCEPDDFALP
jgi:hypothetical protein